VSEAPRHPGEAGSVIRAYDRYAPIYDWIFGSVLEPGRRALASTVHKIVDGAPSMSLLEVGVGTGLTLPLYPESVAVTGVDLSDHMLDKARLRAREMPGRRIELHRMDGERLAFDDGTFDCVTLPYVLSVTPEPERLVAEVRRVCRKDGVILILNHFSGSPFWWTFERLVKPLADRVGFRSDFSFEEQIGRHDWEIRDVRVVNLLGLSRLVSIRNG
jgi:phosphatidylethanolamine/phosphatidyl-N-methylethanolamine N-methyltransferase